MKERISKSGSVEKALTILECFDRKTPFLSLDEISKKIGYPKPTVFRMICSLEKFGYVNRKIVTGETKFTLGMIFLAKGHLVNSQLDIREFSRDEMIKLRNETGLSTQLAIRDGNDAIYIEQHESLNSIRLYPQIGRRAPLYSAACPRVLLAFLSTKEREELLHNYNYTSFTPHTKTDPSLIREELNKIIKNGYGISRGELHEGTVAIAAPIFNINQHVVAALSIVGIDKDFSENNLDHYVQALLSSTEKISTYLK